MTERNPRIGTTRIAQAMEVVTRLPHSYERTKILDGLQELWNEQYKVEVANIEAFLAEQKNVVAAQYRCKTLITKRSNRRPKMPAPMTREEQRAAIDL